MKNDIRKLLCTMSATAVLATMTTFFTGCNNKGKENSVAENLGNTESEVEYQMVNESNAAELTLKKDSAGYRSNLGKAVYKLEKDKKNALIKDATTTKSSIFNEFCIYENKDGQYFVIDKDKAYEITKVGDEYKLLEKEDSYYVLTGEKGRRYLVFGGDAALKNFTKELESKLKEDKVYTIVNGIFVDEPLKSTEVSRFDGTRTYYDFENVMKTVSKAVEDGGYSDPIEYTKEDDHFVVKRTFYTTDDAGNGSGSYEQEIVVPIGNEADVYVDNNVNAFLGMTFKKDETYWVSTETLINLLGIDVVEGEYTVPGTNTTVDAVMIDTTGQDEPEFVVQPKIKKNDNAEVTTNEDGVYDNSSSGGFIVEDLPKVTFVEVDDEFIDNPDPPQNNINDYSQDVYEKLGVKVKLEGTNEEQAQQYYDAVVAAHPTLPWDYGANNVSLNLIDKFIETENEIGDMSAEEVSVILDEKLAGRDYHDLSVEELYDISGYANFANRMEILSYLAELTGRDFNFGGWIA